MTQRHNAEHEDDRLAAFQNGYTDALDKAREVISAMPTAFWINGSTGEAQAHKAYVKAAIDALRGGRDD